MKKIKWVTVPGINTDAEDNLNWSPRACDYIEAFTNDLAREFDNELGPLSRRFKLQDKAVELSKILEQLAGQGFRLKLIGHSNGCEMIRRAMLLTNINIEEIHLVAGACDHDFEKGQWNKLIRESRVKKIIVHASKSDGALRLGKWTTGWLRPVGYGYGWVGLIGPQNVAREFVHRVITIWHDDLWNQKKFGHSEYWDAKKFDRTMKIIASGGNVR